MDESTETGYGSQVACSGGAVSERWTTPEMTDHDLVRLGDTFVGEDPGAATRSHGSGPKGREPGGEEVGITSRWTEPNETRACRTARRPAHRARRRITC